MLVELRIQNFALIDQVELELTLGLNVLSGETGAGKSILLRSLGLLMGAKADLDVIGPRADAATVEGVFDLSRRQDVLRRLQDLGIDASEEQLLVRRVVSGSAKNKILINGVLVTLNNLRDVVAPLIQITGSSAPLIEMTGQHDNRHLLSTDYHLEILDQYANLRESKNKFVSQFEAWRETERDLSELQAKAPQAEQRLDFLRYQRDEIAALDLKPGDESELEIELKRRKGQEKLFEFTAIAETELSTGDDAVVPRLHAILQRLSEASLVDARLAAETEALATAKSLIEDFVYSLRDYAKDLGSTEVSLEDLEQKLSRFRKVQKKFGIDIGDILAQFAQMDEEIAQLENIDTRLEDLRKQSHEQLLALKSLAEKMHSQRVKAAPKLAELINSELRDLNMKGVTTSFELKKLPEPTVSGMTAAQLLVLTSKDDKPRALAKVASGGELSRILLSIKRVIGLSDLPRTYLFDEVDAGVSGPTAERVGKKLKSIARGGQVVCVTHLPQVAALGDTHYLISKNVGSRSTQTTVERLSQVDRVREIARLISGEKITRTSLEHAKQLLST